MKTDPIRILLVEDHADTAKMMRIVLERMGFVVTTANGVEQALEFTDQQQFDVCLCDLRLPDGNGQALSRDLLSRHSLKSICLSGDISRSDLDPEPGGPFTASLAKPIDIPEMLEAIRRATA